MISHRFLKEGADVLSDLQDADRSKFVNDLALPSIKVHNSFLGSNKERARTANGANRPFS